MSQDAPLWQRMVDDDLSVEYLGRRPWRPRPRTVLRRADGERFTLQRYRGRPILDPARCAELIAMFDDDARFRSTVHMARHASGEGRYRYFTDPLPPLVQHLRETWYPPRQRRAVTRTGRLAEHRRPVPFRLGHTEHRGRPWVDVELRSGDLVVFGDAARLAYHGVPKLLPAVDAPDTGTASGRLNVTLRVSGFG